VQYDSNSEFFDGETIVVGFVSSFTTDKIDVTLSEDELSSQTGQNVQQGIQLDVTSQNSYLQYGTQDTGKRPLYTFNAVSHVIQDNSGDSTQRAKQWGRENCFQLDSDSEFDGYIGYIMTWEGIKAKVYCVQENGYYGKVADLQNPSTIYNTEWVLKADGKVQQRETISNSMSSSTVQPGDHAVVTNIGGLTTGVREPSTSNVYALHSNDLNQNWRLIKDDTYDNWDSYVRNQLEDEIIRWGKGNLVGGETGLEDAVNSRASDAFQPAYKTDIYNGATITDTSWGSGTFEYDTAEELVFPRFNVYIDAGENGYVTIEKPVGEPRIIDSSGTEFGELGSGTASMTVRNTAEYEGSFTPHVQSCTSPFSAEEITTGRTVGAGDTVTFKYGISAASGMDQDSIDGSCTLAVENSVGDSVTTSVGVTVNSESECTQGNEVLRYPGEEETIMKCIDGFSLEKQSGDAVCGEGEEARLVSTENGLNDYECRDADNPDPDDEICGNNRDDDGDGKVDENCPSKCEPITLIPNPMGNDLTIPDIFCQFHQAVSGAWGAVTSAAALFAFLVGYGLRVPAMRMAKLHGAVRVLDYKIKLGWIVGIIFGLLLAYGTFTVLSNPVIKWLLIAVGVIGTALYVYVFGLGQLVRSLLPVGP
jgi:hypothetical protein